MKRRKHSTSLWTSSEPRDDHDLDHDNGESPPRMQRSNFHIDLRSTTITMALNLLAISLPILLLVSLSVGPSQAHRLAHSNQQQQQVHRTNGQSFAHYGRQRHPQQQNLNLINYNNQLPTSYMNNQVNTNHQQINYQLAARDELISPESTSLSHNYEPPMMSNQGADNQPVEPDVDSLMGPLVDSVLSGVDSSSSSATAAADLSGATGGADSLGSSLVNGASQLEADEQELHRNQPPLVGALNPQVSANQQIHSSASTNQEDNDATLAENSPQEVPARASQHLNLMNQHHQSRLQAMHDMFERRQLANPQQQQHHQQHHAHQPNLQPHSQELSPISIGLDPSGFGMPPPPSPFVGGGVMLEPKAGADQGDAGLGPALPFGLNPLPHLLGFQNAPFDGPQRGDQSAHSNHHTASPSSDSPVDAPVGGPASQKVWPKIFRFTDGRINLSDFEKQKKIRLSNKNQHNGDNHIESAPIMFDGRQLKRKSFLILHGGIFS